ncbi:hypothetical protein BB560_005472, partial [Smittium megazygosporum]
SIEKESYDRTVTVYNFNVGDSVLLSVEGIRSKFEPAWTGPYKVTEQLQRGNYIIKDSRNNFDVVNGDRLKKFISGNRRVPENNIKVIEGVNLGVAGNLFADMEVKLRNCNLSMNFSSSFPKGTPTNAFPRLFWTPGSSWAAPSTRKVDATESRKREFLQTAKKLSGKNIDPYSGFILPAPKPFSGNWDEDGMAWIDRFQRHVSTFRTQLLDEELMGYSESFYTGAALVWHKSASILYVAWEDYVSAFLIEFNPEKSKARAQKELESFDFYGKDILSTYASLTKLFRILGIVDKDLKVDALFRKLSRSDRELMINQGFTTVNEIMDCLQSQYKRDKLYGSVPKMQNAVGINSSKVNKKDYQVKQRQCYNRRKLGHLARECPNQGPSQEEVGMLKNELYNMNK